MLKVGFILPSSNYLANPFRGDPFTHFQILTILEDYFGSIIDARLIDLRGIEKRFALAHIPECDVYLHSIYTLDYNEQIGITNFLRGACPGAIHIAGGHHVNSFPEKAAKIFDSLILGEGEGNVVLAIQNILLGKSEKVYRQNAPIDINKYPYWRRDFLPPAANARKNLMTLKNKPGSENILGSTVIFSRGCPYSCSFCAMAHIKSSAPGIRFRNPEHIEAEIKYLKSRYKIEGIVLKDEIALPLKSEQAAAHLEAIKKSGILWRGQCRVDGVNPELARRMAESGCTAMGLGVESVSQKCLDLINKRASVKKAKETIRLLKENGIEVRIYLIMGLPGETEDIVEQTWSFIEETDPDLVYLSLFTVRPGTDVFNYPEKFGIRHVGDDWDNTKHNRLGKDPNEMLNLTFEYQEQASWGKSLSNDQIVGNYLELRKRLTERGLYISEFFKKHVKDEEKVPA